MPRHCFLLNSVDEILIMVPTGSVASLWQQCGRAGRREQCSLSIYVAFDDPLDQYFIQHPKCLFGRPIECVQIDASNCQILEQHLVCAAYELPLQTQDEEIFGKKMMDIVGSLVQCGKQPNHHILIVNQQIMKSQ